MCIWRSRADQNRHSWCRFARRHLESFSSASKPGGASGLQTFHVPCCKLDVDTCGNPQCQSAGLVRNPRLCRRSCPLLLHVSFCRTSNTSLFLRPLQVPHVTLALSIDESSSARKNQLIDPCLSFVYRTFISPPPSINGAHRAHRHGQVTSTQLHSTSKYCLVLYLLSGTRYL